MKQENNYNYCAMDATNFVRKFNSTSKCRQNFNIFYGDFLNVFER